MKISGYKHTGEIFKAYQQNKLDKTKDPKGTGETKQADTLELSQEAKSKKEIQSTLKELPEVRQDLVNRLKKEIQAGTYKPDANKIADGIIRERLLDKEV